jgi:S-DNA-T family DNA segregation ATPase FtsK/SpoIIIE
VRDGAAVGLTCVLTADRAGPGGRLAAVARQRLILPLPDAADYAVAGVPARVVPAFRPPGRTLLGDDPLECQLALPRRPPPASTVAPGTRPPLRIVELPPDPVPTELHDGQAGNTPLRLPVGPGGDEGAPLLVDLLRSGGLLVSGPSGSGRTTALDTFAAHLGTAGAAVLRIGRPSPRRADEPEATEVRRLEPGDALGVSEWLQALAGRPGVVLADDVGTPSEWAALTALPAPGAGLALVAASSAGQLSGHYQGPVAALRRNRSGLLLCPGPGDADLLGVRLPRTPLPVRPGSGWLVTGGAMERVQVARHRASAPQSRSSAGPISWLAYQASS